MAMTIMGDRTPRAIIQKSESHKLHHAFAVAQGKTIYQGQQVVLLEDGTVRAYEADDANKMILGIAVTDNVNPAYAASKQNEVEVTVAMRGYMIIYGVNNTAGALKAGPVKPQGTRKGTYDYYVADATTEYPVAINLTKAAAKDDLIQILIL